MPEGTIESNDQRVASAWFVDGHNVPFLDVDGTYKMTCPGGIHACDLAYQHWLQTGGLEGGDLYGAKIIAATACSNQMSACVRAEAINMLIMGVTTVTGARALASAGPLPGLAAEVGPGQGRLVIGKLDDLGRRGALKPGERTLSWGDRGSNGENAQVNAGLLRREMNRRQPIRDATIDPVTREPVEDTGFLRAERYLLRDRGWTYDARSTLWLPPGA
jgi:hypothetical protein